MSTATTTIENFIGGEHSAPAAGATEEILNPATGEVIATAPLSDASDVDAAVAAAAAAFDGWATTVPGERALALLRIADALEQRGEEISQLESLNVGKPIGAMREEMPAIVDNLRFFAGAARVMEGKAAGEYLEGYTSMLRREPIGVIGQIAPWNYPLAMAIWKVGPALAAGNTVVLKPSELTPMTAALLADVCAEHLPPGVLNVIYGHGESAGAPLVRHKDVAMVALTGSVETGKGIARVAADTLKRVHLELGGKAPGARLRRRRHRGRGRGRQDRRLLERRARTAPRRRACSPARRSTTTSSARWPRRSTTSPSATRRPRTPRWAR